MKVLYVEDNTHDVDLLLRELAGKAPEVSVDIATTQNQALEMLTDEQPLYDLALIDLHLPDGSGLDLLTKIRKKALPLAVVILTGHGDEEAAVTALKAGAEDYLVKKNNYLSRLPLALETALEHYRAEVARRQHPLRVLYVEHSKSDLDLTRRHMIQYAPYIHIQEAHTASEALRILAADEELYDVLLLDYRLPGLNALELLKSLTRELKSDIPVVLVTGQGDEEVATQAMHLGAVDYLVKHTGYLFQLPAILENTYHRYQLIREKDALKKSEARYRRLAENARDIIYRIRLAPERCFEYVNPIVTDITGYTPEDHYADPDLGMKIVHPEDLHLLEQISRGDIPSDEPLILRWLHKDGRVIWIEQRNVMIYDEDGDPVAVEGIARNITGRKQAEEALRYREELLREMGSVARVGGWEYDLMTEKGTWTDEVAEIYDLEPHAIANEELVLSLFQGESRERIESALKKMLDFGHPYNLELELLTTKGAHKWVQIIGRAILNNGKVVKIKGSIQDITDRKRIEETMHEAESRLRLAISASHIGLWDWDLATNKVYFSKEWKEQLGYAEDEIPNRFEEWQSLLHPDDLDSMLGKVRKSIEKADANYSAEFRLRHKDGSYRWISTLAQIFCDSVGQPLRMVGCHIDITKHKQAEEALNNRLTELETLYKVSSSLSSAETLDEMLQVMLEETLAVIQAKAGAIKLYHPSEGKLSYATARGWLTKQDDAPIMPGEGIVGTVYSTGEAHIYRDFSCDSLLKPPYDANAPQGWSGACLPIRSAKKTVGVFLVSVPLPRVITSRELKLLTSLTEMTGTAVHRLSLHEETAGRLQQLQSLRTVDQAINASLDLRHSLDILLEHVTAQSGVDGACVFLVHPYLNELELVTNRGFKSTVFEQDHLRLSETAIGRSALEHRTVIFSEPAVALDEKCTNLLQAEGFYACISIPLIAKGEAKGILAIFQRHPYNPDQERLNFFETLAGQAAIAVDNARLFDDLQHANLELRMAYNATIEGWSYALDLRDHETEGHSKRVMEMTIRIGRLMGIKEEKLSHMRRGALLHDIGKMAIPDAILQKPDQLDDNEWEIMRRHPQIAFDMLSSIEYLRPALEIPYCHHEKWDGSGYPRNLHGEQIPIEARIFAVVDVYDALTSDRPYRNAWAKQRAMEYICEQSGKHFDPTVVTKFLEEYSL